MYYYEGLKPPITFLFFSPVCGIVGQFGEEADPLALASRIIAACTVEMVDYRVLESLLPCRVKIPSYYPYCLIIHGQIWFSYGFNDMKLPTKRTLHMARSVRVVSSHTAMFVRFSNEW